MLCRYARQFSGRAPRIQRSHLLADAGYARLIIRLFGGRQPGGFPGFKTAGHVAGVFVAHFLQALGRERATAAAAAMTKDHCVRVGNFFFDVELDGTAVFRNERAYPYRFLTTNARE